MLLDKSVSVGDEARRSFISSCSTGLFKKTVTNFSRYRISVKSDLWISLWLEEPRVPIEAFIKNHSSGAIPRGNEINK